MRRLAEGRGTGSIRACGPRRADGEGRLVTRRCFGAYRAGAASVDAWWQLPNSFVRLARAPEVRVAARSIHGAIRPRLPRPHAPTHLYRTPAPRSIGRKSVVHRVETSLAVPAVSTPTAGSWDGLRSKGTEAGPCPSVVAEPVFFPASAYFAGVRARVASMGLERGAGIAMSASPVYGQGLRYLTAAVFVGGPLALLDPHDHRQALVTLADPALACWRARATSSRPPAGAFS
jgi:hypothetical protein